MKQIKQLLFIVTVFLGSFAYGQAPDKMSYQAVVRNASNNLVANQAVGMQISILQGSATGTPVYVETQAPTSNANGLITLQIGGGNVVSGNMTTIDWANGPFFVKTETDPTGGTNYSIIGTSQLLSVPYALYAKTSGSSIPGPQGPQGLKGDKGDTGLIGPMGPQGPAGPQGLTGPIGSMGPQGSTGPQGLKGDKGDPGTNGSSAYQVAVANGFVGTETQWLTSLEGPQGPKGDKGDKGDTGTNGSSAYQVAVANGFVGTETQWLATLKGDTGATGPQGLKGDTGLTGATGPIGPQGPAGPQGLKGDKGDTGAQGPQGIQGLTGATGPQGQKGDTGLTGPQGLKGDKGDTGLTGATGPQGLKGDTGATGATGPQGPAGTNGTNGQGVPTGGTTGQVLAKVNGTDYNTQWVTPSVGGSGGATLDLLATNTSSTAIFALANGSNTGDVVTYNNVVTAPTLGSYNSSNNTYTVGVTGLYTIQAVTRCNDAATPSNTVGQFLVVDVDGVGISSANTIITDYPTTTGSNMPAGAKGRGFTSVTLYLTAGQTVRVLGLSANSSTAMQPLKTDGSCKFMVIKL